MTRKEAINNLNMISVAFVEAETKEQRKIIDDTFNMAIQALGQEPCDDVISREYLFKVLDDFCGHDRTATITLDTLADLVYDMPSVKPQEPKEGHWKWVQYDSNPNIGNWHCSECNRIVCGAIKYAYKYCPQCGAKMESEEEDTPCGNCDDCEHLDGDCCRLIYEEQEYKK